MVCGPPGSSVRGIFQAGIPRWLPFLPPGDLSDPGIEPVSLVSPPLQADSLSLSHWEALYLISVFLFFFYFYFFEQH